MRRFFPEATAVATILYAAVFLGACAQAGLSSTPSTREVEGRVVDVRGTRVLLNDGTVLLIPETVANLSQLPLGVTIRVQYEEKDGQKVATSMVFREGGMGQAPMP
jgi:hypothetical protein